MINFNFRPQNLSSMVGNEINNKLLLAVAKNGGPSTYIFAGDYGCGKTTMARLFAKMCNCQHLTNDICGHCSICEANLNKDNNYFYSEFDSSILGHIDSIRDLYEDLTFVPKGIKRVITFDEFHLTSRAAQSALLKLFEEAPPNIYYVLCTTDKNAILPTIISRSLTLNFTTKAKDDIVANLNAIAKANNIEISDNITSLIALRSKGHMRDAHKLFEKYLLIGEKDFIALEESSYIYLAKYFAQVLWLLKNARTTADNIKKHKDTMLELIDRIMRVPVAMIKDDYQKLFLDIARKLFDPEYTTEPIIDALVKTYDARSLMSLYKIALDDFSMSSFDNDIKFKTALLAIYQRMILSI